MIATFTEAASSGSALQSSDATSGSSGTTATQTPVWVRPVGSGWKIRCRGELENEQLRRRLEERGFQLTPVLRTDRWDEYYQIARTEELILTREVEQFLRELPGYRLMNDPA